MQIIFHSISTIDVTTSYPARYDHSLDDAGQSEVVETQHAALHLLQTHQQS